MKNLFVFTFLILPLVLLQSQEDLKLPPLLEFADGTKVKTTNDWRKRRAELQAVFEQEMYGVAPELPKGVTYTVEIEDKNAFGGKATKKRVNLTLKGLANPLELLIYYPNNGLKKASAFLLLNFWGNYTVSTDKEVPMPMLWVPNREFIKDHKATEAMRGIRADRFPVEMIVDAGYAVVTLYSGDIDPDFNDGFKNGVHALYKDPKYTWGTVAAWAWGLSYVMNYLEKDKRINAKQVAVLGHSRLGKAALLAGAFDERFALVISNNSGCGGAAISRRKMGETLAVLNKNYPHWFCPNFKNYNKKEDELPIDQHQLAAMVAPRLLYVASSELDTWADPEGEFLSAYFAGEVYRLFGLKGIQQSNMPALESPLHDGHVGYHIRKGKHGLTSYDWQQYILFADRHFKKK
ncbi:MAG: acetylxylan esterase [Paludibacter sp.]|nr:acetylxylan esterase [Paludibacter sp.]